MAKILITVEDLPNGQVKIEATPNFMTMMQMDMSGNSLTSAHGYALRMLNEATKASKAFEPNNRLIVPVPRVRRPS